MTRNLRVVVTGGCGFIGSEVVRVLLKKGFTVRVVDNLSKRVRTPPTEAEFVQVDLTDSGATREAFDGFEYCVSLAAKVGGIGYFHKYPAAILSENNKMYSNTFENAVRCRFRQMVYVSSSMVFEATQRFPSSEDDLAVIPPPMSSYGFSKLVGEWYCKSFWEEFRLPYTILRPFNAFGINEAPEAEPGMAHVIPDLVKKMLDGQNPLEILGDGNQTRCFTHVRDIAEAIPLVLTNERALNEDFNLGSDREISIKELAFMLHRMIRPDLSFEFRTVPSHTFDVSRRVPNVTKAKKILGWTATISLEEGLPEVLEWLRKNHIAGVRNE